MTSAAENLKWTIGRQARPRFFVALTAGLLASAAAEAGATGTLSSGDHVPLEQRVALATSAERTTLWTQARLRTVPGPVALVVPAPVGASLDWASPAWMEALDLATAPRVRPPSDLVPACPGEPPPDDPVDVVGEVTPLLPLAPLEITVLANADEVVIWAGARGMAVPPPLYASMSSLTDLRFVAARFEAPDGEALTPTLRVSAPTPSPALPLLLTRATTEDLLVTAFTLAEGRADLDGPDASLDVTQLSYDASTATTSYEQARWSALSEAGPGSTLLECATRSALAGDVAVGVGGHVIESALATYFSRAASYEGGAIDAASCVATADASLETPAPVALACPRADLGVVQGNDDCQEIVAAGELDPSLLRCGEVADDLAVALSGQVASDSWLTRHSTWIPVASTGSLRMVSVVAGAAKQPIYEAQDLDTSGCDGEGGATGGGTGEPSPEGPAEPGGAGGAPGAAPAARVPVYEVTDNGCGVDDVGAYPIFYLDVDESEAPPDAYYVDDSDDCGGDTSDAYSPVYEDEDETDGPVDDVAEDASAEDCGGDTAESYGDDDGDCGGDTAESYGDDDGDCGCGGDTAESYGDDYDDGDCGGDTSEPSDGDCSFSSRRRSTRPRLSPLVLSLFGMLMPLRRLTRPRRRRRRATGKRR